MPRPRTDRHAALMNEPYEQLRAAGGVGAVLEVWFDGVTWEASVTAAGRRKPLAVGSGSRLEEACRALAVELGVERWHP